MNFTLLILNIFHFLNDGIRTSFVSLLPFISHDLHIGLTVVGILGASQGFLAFLLSIPAGLITRKIRGLILLFVSMLVYSIGAAAIGLAPNTIILVPIFFLAVSGFAMFHPIGYALTARASNPTNRGENMGNFTAMGDIGRSMIPPIAVFLAVIIGWRWTIIGIGLIGILLYFFFRYYFQQKNPKLLATKVPQEQESIKEWLTQMVLLFHNKKMRLITIGSLVDAFAGGPIYIFLPFFILALGIKPELLGIFMAAYFVGSLSGKALLGRAVDIIGNAKIFITIEFLMGSFLFLLTFTHNPLLLGFIIFFLGLFTRGTTPVVLTLLSQESHEKHYEKVFAFSNLFFEAAGWIAPVIFGIIAEQFGLVLIFYIASILAIIATLPIIIYTKLKG